MSIDPTTVSTTLNTWITGGMSANDIATAAMSAQIAYTQAGIVAAMPALPAGFDAAYVTELRTALDALLAQPGLLNPTTATSDAVRAILSGDPQDSWNKCFIAIASMISASGKWITTSNNGS
jgi:hypothetical protein